MVNHMKTKWNILHLKTILDKELEIYMLRGC